MNKISFIDPKTRYRKKLLLLKPSYSGNWILKTHLIRKTLKLPPASYYQQIVLYFKVDLSNFVGL